MLKESKADIFVDPVLHTACALDLKHHCAAINPGRGRRECDYCFVCIIHNTLTLSTIFKTQCSKRTIFFFLKYLAPHIFLMSLLTVFLTECSVSQFNAL